MNYIVRYAVIIQCYSISYNISYIYNMFINSIPPNCSMYLKSETVHRADTPNIGGCCRKTIAGATTSHLPPIRLFGRQNIPIFCVWNYTILHLCFESWNCRSGTLKGRFGAKVSGLWPLGDAIPLAWTRPRPNPWRMFGGHKPETKTIDNKLANVR